MTESICTSTRNTRRI